MLRNCRNLRTIFFRDIIQSGRANAPCLSASRSYVVQNKCSYLNATPKNCLILSCSNPVRECVRFKSKNKNKGSQREEYESDSDEDEDDMSFDEDGRPLTLKKLNSIRLDSILMKVFGFTRRKTEELLLGNHVYVNDAVGIKSQEIKPSDIVEVKDLLDVSSGAKNRNLRKMEFVKIKPCLINNTFSVAYVEL